MSHIRLAQLPADEPQEEEADDGQQPLQRLRIVRRLQGMSFRAVARQLHATIAHVRLQERPSADILLSELYRWQRVLEVPIAELVAESAEDLGGAR